MSSFISQCGQAQLAAARIIITRLTKELAFIPAIGALANAQHESSLKLNAVGDNGEAFALWQWHGDRCAVIRQATGIDLTKGPDPATQCQALVWELKNIEKPALVAIMAAKTPYEAGSVFCTKFERAGAPGQADLRGQDAEAWATWAAQVGLAQ